MDEKRRGEMHLEIQVEGFQKTTIDLDIKTLKSRFKDEDVLIHDLNMHPLSIGMRISLHRAGFHLTFFSHAVILIEARQLMHKGFLHLKYS